MNVTNLTSFIVRSDTINAYISEINKIPTLNAQEERDLFSKYEDLKGKKGLYTEALSELLKEKNSGSREVPEEELASYRHEISVVDTEMTNVRNEIIARNLRFNFAVAKRYSNGDLLPDLVNTGVIGMYEAFNEYDWHKDIRFCSFAVWFIRRSINAYLNKENLIVRPKNNVRIAPKVRKIENEFFLKNGRKPYPVEVIDALRRDYGIEVKDEIDIYGARVDRLDSFLGDDDDFTFEQSPVFNEKTATANEFDEKSEGDFSSYAIDTMMKVLSEREQTVVRMAFGYGYNREYKDKEIGDVLGLTSERVRQLRHGALKKMRAAYMANVD